jgi:hypothetical protein
MAEDRINMARGGVRAGEGEMSEAEIDANVEGTFPASDPPSWTLGTDHSGEPDTDRLKGD